jgi:hypothetical protein
VEGEGCVFVLLFDNGGFPEGAASGIGERFAHAPEGFPGASLCVPKSAYAGIPSGERSALAVRHAASDEQIRRAEVGA